MDGLDIKSCPRCNAVFECKPAEIINCLCYTIQLTEEQRAYIGRHFTGCLCADCLEAISGELMVQ